MTTDTPAQDTYYFPSRVGSAEEVERWVRIQDTLEDSITGLSPIERHDLLSVVFHWWGKAQENTPQVRPDPYNGACPECPEPAAGSGEYPSAYSGSTEVSYCTRHRTSWVVSHGYDSPDQTDDEQRAIWDEVGLDEFTRVDPVYYLREWFGGERRWGRTVTGARP